MNVRRRTSPSRHTLVHFTRQLSVFVKGGIPLDRSLRIIAEETTESALGTTLMSVLADLDAGESFSLALSRHPRVFPAYFVGLMRSAEATGALAETLDSLTAYQVRLADTRSKITSALTYPSIVMLLALVTVVILTAFVIPRFEPLFDELGSTIPLPTRILLGSTTALTSNIGWVLGSLAGVGTLVFAVLRSGSGRRLVDRWLLRTPIVGTIVRYIMLERFCRILAVTIRSGLSVTSGMRLSTQTISNSVHRDLLTRATQDMTMGIGFASALTRTGLFPGAARQMFRVGEETGALDEQVTAAGEFFDAELEIRIRRFTSLFEPVLIVFVGLVVGFVAVALVSAMYGVLDGVRDIA